MRHWHKCVRWHLRGLQCPFSAGAPHKEISDGVGDPDPDEPPDDEIPWRFLPPARFLPPIIPPLMMPGIEDMVLDHLEELERERNRDEINVIDDRATEQWQIDWDLVTPGGDDLPPGPNLEPFPGPPDPEGSPFGNGAQNWIEVAYDILTDFLPPGPPAPGPNIYEAAEEVAIKSFTTWSEPLPPDPSDALFGVNDLPPGPSRRTSLAVPGTGRHFPTWGYGNTLAGYIAEALLAWAPW